MRPGKLAPVLPPDGMTPAQAMAAYDYGLDPARWHAQPVCRCGDYLAQHDPDPPHRCLLPGIPSAARCCAAFRYARMGQGGNGA